VSLDVDLRDGIGRSEYELTLETVSGTLFIDHGLSFRNIISAQRSKFALEERLTKNMGPLPWANLFTET
jgi:hypothetical protein